MMLFRRQRISYLIVERTIWLKGYQNGNHIRAIRTRLQEIRSIFCTVLVTQIVRLTLRYKNVMTYVAILLEHKNQQ